MRWLATLGIALALAGSARADWEVKRSPFNAQLIERYRAMLRRDPDDAFPWKRLVGLYKSHRTLDELERDLQARAAKSREFEDLYLVGRMALERGDLVGSLARHKEARTARPLDVRGMIAVAEVESRLGHREEARRSFDAALERLAAKDPRRRAVLVNLFRLVSSEEDSQRLLYFTRTLKQMEPNDLELRREIAEALAKDHPVEALAEWTELASRWKAQPERCAGAWKRIGELSETTAGDVAALDAYRKGFALLPPGNYLRRELIDKVIGVYRRKEDLRSLVALLEKGQHGFAGRGFFEWETLARLHEETGNAVAATAAYKKALAADPHAQGARKKLIALYERTGREDDALGEYQKLCAQAPGEARFQLELAERHSRRGAEGRKKALELLQKVAARFPGDPSVHSALAELYGRWGDSERAQREQELLAKLEPNEETHLVDLGEIYYQRGKKKLAVDTWQKLVTLGKDRATGLSRLADVLVDHDMAGEAVELYEKAVTLAPKDFAARRGLAAALERMQRTAEAEQRWMEIYDQARDPKVRSVRQEARQRLVLIAHREGRLAVRISEFKRRFDGPPPDDDFGLVLADAWLKHGRTDEAERTLAILSQRAVTDDAKGEAELGLAQVLKARHKLKEAIAAFERAAKLLPSRARELYGQAAELSLQLYRDDDALAYAHKAVALARNDAQAQVRLAEIHEKKEDDQAAIGAYTRALALDGRLFRVDFALARLHLRRGQLADAARLYRDVVLRAPEEELVLDAAHRAIDLEEYLGTLGDLARALTPLAYLHVQKPVYRKLLVELYDRYATPLAILARRGDPAAERELQRLGEYGLKPLLEALVDGEPGEQKVAVALLGELQNRAAAAPLAKLACRAPEPGAPDRGSNAADIDVRIDAALAAALLADPKTLPELQRLAGDREKHLRVAALVGLARIRDPRARKALERALGDSVPDVQAMACLGLAQSGADARARGQMRALLIDGARPETVRAACAAALGSLGDGASVDALIEALRQGNDAGPRAAAWALGAIGDRRAEPALLAAVFVKHEDVRQVAAAALSQLADSGPKGALGAPAIAAPLLALPRRPARASDGGAGLDVAALVAGLARPPAAPDRLRWAGADSKGLRATGVAAALEGALARHRDLQLRTLDDLVALAPGGRIGLGPLTPPALGLAEPEQRAAGQLLDDVAARLEPSLLELARTGDPLVRARALEVIGRLSSPAASTARLAALDDPSIDVRLAAIAAVATDRAAEGALAKRLAAPEWRERAAAAEALAKLPFAHGAADRCQAIARLLDDPNGYVREHAARALRLLGAPAIAPLADHVGDEIPEVRRAIARSLAGAPQGSTGRGRAALLRLARDPDPSVREAAAPALAPPPAP